MRYKLLFGFLLLLSTSALANAQVGADSSRAKGDTCRTVRDEFKQQTWVDCPLLQATVESKPPRPTDAEVTLTHSEGETWIIIQTISSDWYFIDVRTAYAIIDGKNLELDVRAMGRDAGARIVKETNGIRLAPSHVRMVSSTSKFRIKMGRIVFRLPAEGLSRQARYVLKQ